MSSPFDITIDSKDVKITCKDVDIDYKINAWLNLYPVKIKLHLEKWFPKRSNEQRDFVMGVWLPLVLNHLGYFPHEADRVYNECKREFWYEERTSKNGVITRIVKKTRENNTKEYSIFMEAFRGWCWDVHAIDLPEPDKSKSRRYKNQKEP